MNSSLKTRVDKLEQQLDPGDGLLLRVLREGEAPPGDGPHYELTPSGRLIQVLFISEEDAKL
jgi:hypothetical protein